MGLGPLRDEALRLLDGDRWGSALITVGWVHMGFFLVCQILFTSGNRAAVPMLLLWLGELLTILFTMRWIVGAGWQRQSTLSYLAFKFWITFLILSFNVASLNQLSGMATDWFKPIWATLSTYVFMGLTFLFTPWFFAGAVLMYFTGLLMVRFPDWNYAIYGASWCLALQVMGGLLVVRARRRRAMADVGLGAGAGPDRSLGLESAGRA